VEISEHSMSVHCGDGTIKPDNGTKVSIETLSTALVKMGRPHPDVEFLKTLLAEVGFEDIHANQVKEPVGPWPKDPKMKRLGAMVLLNAETYAESLRMAAFTRVLVWILKRRVEYAMPHALLSGTKITICTADSMCPAAARHGDISLTNGSYSVYSRKPAAEEKIPENV
jgi:hypothetical protein